MGGQEYEMAAPYIYIGFLCSHLAGYSLEWETAAGKRPARRMRNLYEIHQSTIAEWALVDVAMNV